MTSRLNDPTVLPISQAAPEDVLRTTLTTLIHETLEREFAGFVGADRFEHDHMAVRLLSALAMERNEQWMARRYFDELLEGKQDQAA